MKNILYILLFFSCSIFGQHQTMLLVSQQQYANESSYPSELVGLWEFADSGDLGKATVGTDLTINGTAPTYSASFTDSFSKTLNHVITNTQGVSNNLLATHGIGANGGGTKTNIYTIVFDVHTSQLTYRALMQTNLANSSDAPYFIRTSTNVLGSSTISYSSTSITGSKWIRIVLSVDASSGGSGVKSFYEGNAFTHTAQSVDALITMDASSVLLFADNDNENPPLEIGMVAIFDIALNQTQVNNLGVAGDPIQI